MNNSNNFLGLNNTKFYKELYLAVDNSLCCKHSAALPVCEHIQLNSIFLVIYMSPYNQKC